MTETWVIQIGLPRQLSAHDDVADQIGRAQ